MSGGSFNYLYSKDIEQFYNSPDDRHDMIDFVESLVFADDLAKYLRKEFDLLSGKFLILQETKETMDDILKDIEWFASGDHGEETFKNILNEWRKKIGVPKCK